MERKGQERKRKKRGMQFIPYDYEAAYNKAIADLNEWFVEQMFSHGKKMVYALKEITAGEQFEIEIYPQFRKMDDVPKEGQRVVPLFYFFQGQVSFGLRSTGSWRSKCSSPSWIARWVS